MELIWDDLTPNELKAAQYQAMQTFYWEKKDLPNYLLAAKAVLELLLEYAKKNVALRGEYADVAIQTSYNIASMTWAGRFSGSIFAYRHFPARSRQRQRSLRNFYRTYSLIS